MSDTDLQLLARYTRDRAEDAFAELVHRHLDLVHSAALRQVRSRQLAEEVAQSVFTDLARNAHRFAPDTILTAWLYQVTRRTAIDVVRREARRQLREQIATEMNAMNATANDWTHIEPLLDEAMSALDETDRAAVLLRYFKNKTLREVGATLGTSDDAAQKRVSRAVERLREFFAKRGITVGTSGLILVLSANAVQAAPIGLAVTISTAAALAGLGIPVAFSGGAIAGFFGALVQTFRSKVVVGLTATVLLGTLAFILFRSYKPVNQSTVTDVTLATTPNVDQNQEAAATPDGGGAGAENETDPLMLLKAVARARQRIVSGSMEFQLSVEQIEPGRNKTNHLRLVASFDGPKLRFESFAREYSYTYSADEAEQEEIKKRADSMDREAAIQAGLTKPFESHHALAYDGTVLLDYWENDGKPAHMTIDDPKKGSGNFIFDPRCLGLRTSLSVGNTIENCLGYNEAKSIRLLGEESVEGVLAWRVQVQTRYEETLDFWLAVSQPTRVLKHARGADFVVSEYDDNAPRDPLPVVVTATDFRNGSPSFGKRFIRSSSHFNVTIDPSSFTLAGLGMQVGTSVSDGRISRSIGYWTGAGLSDYPPKKGTAASTPPDLSELLAVLEYNPTSTGALDASVWILLNVPDGPEVEKAAEVILQEHTGSTNLVHLCKELERVRHRCATNLLAAILNNNPSREVQVTACFTWATLLKDEAKFGQNKIATAKAERLFQRVMTDFNQAGPTGVELARRAKLQLYELHHLIIGKPAPDTEGGDLTGQPMKLSDYRGNVVVLVFWSGDFSESRDYRKLIENMAGKPFVFLGVNCDRDLARATGSVEKYEITWPSFRDGRDGPISSLWNVNSWPDLWVLDRRGVIRYRNVRWRELSDAVNTLLGE